MPRIVLEAQIRPAECRRKTDSALGVLQIFYTVEILIINTLSQQPEQGLQLPYLRGHPASLFINIKLVGAEPRNEYVLDSHKVSRSEGKMNHRPGDLHRGLIGNKPLSSPKFRLSDASSLQSSSAGPKPKSWAKSVENVQAKIRTGTRHHILNDVLIHVRRFIAPSLFRGMDPGLPIKYALRNPPETPAGFSEIFLMRGHDVDGEKKTGMLVGRELEILDTTLRDGAQGEGISFSVQDKIAVVRALDDLGIAWIEAGNPGSNPKDAEFFHIARGLHLAHSRLCAFGPTRKPDRPFASDSQIRSLLDAETEGAVIFGKSWDLHVTEVLRVSLDENLAMIFETVAFLRDQGRKVFYDAEHFFDGWKANPAYALSTIKAAREAGAETIVLCDTNGGSFPDEIARAIASAAGALGDGVKEGRAVLAEEGVPGKKKREQPLPASCSLGIHAHNDMGLAIANTLEAVKGGTRHVQGTLVGFGERCGNTCLASLIPSLELKLGFRCLPPDKLPLIAETTRRVAEITNIPVPGIMPYVGSSAFSHKGGMHTDGVLKVRRSFEHVDPALVGNNRHLLMSEMGGRSTVAERLRKIDPSFTKDHPVVAAIAEKLKALEAEGWAFEGADASFELLVRRELGRHTGHPGASRQSLFKILAYRVVSEHPTGETITCSHAWVKVLVEGKDEIAAAEGDGPVNALDGALRRALTRFYPELERVRLSDYKVRVIDGASATAARVRVLIESTDGFHSWSTLGVSEDIIDASRAALVDSIEYKLIADIERKFQAYL